MDDEKIMQIDVPEVDMDGANSDLNNIFGGLLSEVEKNVKQQKEKEK